MSKLNLCGLALLAVMSLALSPAVSAWGTSVHHDQAIIISDALGESPSIPDEIRENVCSDTIYATSLAADDWRDVTDEWGTWQYNMAENAYYEFQRIENAWRDNDFDNAIARIGIVLHYIGDALDPRHSGGPRRDSDRLDGVRDWYHHNIEPLGLEDPLFEDEEGGHMGRHQMEAYVDTDSVWSPRMPENYGTIGGSTDDGSLDWFLNNYFYNTAIDNDSPSWDDILGVSGGPTVMGLHMRQVSPYVLGGQTPTSERFDNRWFYWVSTRDPAIPKMDADNTIRLTYNGVYRALRDGEWLRRGNSGNPPADWGYWPWPTSSAWLSLNDDLYEEGMDVVRWYQGTTTYGAKSDEPQGDVSAPPLSAPQILLVVIGVVILVASVVRWRTRGRSKSR